MSDPRWQGFEINLTDRTAILLHLLEAAPVRGGTARASSSFVAALTDARNATGRDPRTGELRNEPSSGNWLGAIGYMAVLDQVGVSLKPRHRALSDSPEGIIRALEHWTVLDRREIEALYALRCALAHDYSLFNRRPSSPSRQHLFALDQSPELPIVRFPTLPWDGSYDHRYESMQTWVSLRLLGDLVEQIVLNIRSTAAGGHLEIILPGGAGELAARYTLLLPPSS